METLFRISLESEKKIEVIYLSLEGTVSQRIIRVIEINDDHLLAFCYKRMNVRRFYKDRILSAFSCVQKKGWKPDTYL